jgi:undecaprenyl-diphosphatase
MPQSLRLPHGDRGTLSFPSSHAVNIAAAATVLGLSYPAWSVPLAAGAAVVGLSRVYLGLHYPSDVLGGFFIGVLIGFLLDAVARRAASAQDAAESPKTSR